MKEFLATDVHGLTRIKKRAYPYDPWKSVAAARRAFLCDLCAISLASFAVKCFDPKKPQRDSLEFAKVSTCTTGEADDVPTLPKAEVYS
jgi:hypothetical protein